MSLRDVERTLKVFGWMYKQTEVFDAIEELKLKGQDDLDISQSATEVLICFIVSNYIEI